MQCLKQSTVQVIPFGPILDKGDGVTLETAAGIITSLDDPTTGIMLSKNGGTLAVREQGAHFVASTYDAHGCFKVSLSAIDTGTLGRLRVIHTEPATYLPVWQDYMIVPANVWDSLFGADLLDVNVAEQANIDFGALQKASLAAAALAAVGGGGAISWVYTLTETGTGAPIADADVWATTDSAGTNVVASGRTDVNGEVTFLLDAGTYYIWRQKSGWNFINPDTEVVS
jgi:hypothetical protein